MPGFDQQVGVIIKKGDKIMGKGIEWKRIHDLKAYHVYRKFKEGENKRKLCEELKKDKYFQDRSLYSIILKIENYRYIDTGGREGCKGYSDQAVRVFEEYKDKTIQEIKEAVSQYEKNTALEQAKASPEKKEERSMDKETQIKEKLKERTQERDKLFNLMLSNESKEKVKEQFAIFEKAHKEALKVYKDVA